MGEPPREGSDTHGGLPAPGEFSEVGESVCWEGGIQGLAKEALGLLRDLLLAVESMRASVCVWGRGEEPRPHSEG